MNTNESEPVLYELHYTLKAGNPEDAAAKAGTVVGMIEKEHGIVASQTQPSLKTLAFPIKKMNEAYVGWIRFMVKPEAAVELEKNLRTDADILRFMLTRTKKDDFGSEPRRKRIDAPATTPESQAKTKEIDKKLEEILGV